MKPFLGALGVFIGTGCLSPAVYRTAHVVPEGRWDLALTVSAQQVVTAAYSVDQGTVNFAKASGRGLGVIPEISLHHGLGHNLEVGGRLAVSGPMAELDAKYSFTGSGDSPLHVAVQPAVGGRGRFGSMASDFRESAIDVGGYHVTLPLIVTYDVIPRIALTGSVFGHFTSYQNWSDNEPDVIGDVGYAGAAANARFQLGRSIYLVPSFEFQRSVWRGNRPNSAPTVTNFIAGIGLGFGSGPGESRGSADETVDAAH